MADPDREELVSVDGLQEHDRLFADHVETDPVDDHLLHLKAPCGRGCGARRAIIGTGLGLPAGVVVRTLWRVDRSGHPKQMILANGMPLVEMPMAGRLATTVAIA